MATQQNIDDIFDVMPKVEAIIGYDFKEHDILFEALLEPGFHAPYGNGNKRLALLGDAAMRLALLEHWYTTTGTARGTSPISSDIPRIILIISIGDGQALLNRVGSNDNLQLIGRKAGLTMLITPNQSQPREIPIGTMSATVQAILGAVYVDAKNDSAHVAAINDIAPVTQVMRKLGLGPVLDR